MHWAARRCIWPPAPPPGPPRCVDNWPGASAAPLCSTPGCSPTTTRTTRPTTATTARPWPPQARAKASRRPALPPSKTTRQSLPVSPPRTPRRASCACTACGTGPRTWHRRGASSPLCRAVAWPTPATRARGTTTTRTSPSWRRRPWRPWAWWPGGTPCRYAQKEAREGREREKREGELLLAGALKTITRRVPPSSVVVGAPRDRARGVCVPRRHRQRQQQR